MTQVIRIIYNNDFVVQYTLFHAICNAIIVTFCSTGPMSGLYCINQVHHQLKKNQNITEQSSQFYTEITVNVSKSKT